MKSLLGLHWLREHPDNNRDFAHIEAMQYRSIKPFKPLWDNRDACANLLAVLPKDAYILARDHDLSEQKQGIWDNPEKHGEYHANEWAMKVASGVYHLPVERTFFLPVNEPDADSGDRDKIDRYTAAFLNRLKVHGLRGGAFNFSTGHPRTVDGTPDTLADYTVFERSHQAIVAGHHIGVLHIYGTGAVPNAPGHYDRLKACDWQDVEWVVGEFAVDEHVIGGGEHAGFHKYFDGRLNDYCGWLDTAIMGIADPRIHSYQVFTHDFSHPWGSFDIRPIRDALEAYDWQHVKQQPPPANTATLYVIAPAGLNLRADPDMDSTILVAVSFGEPVLVIAASSVDGWLRVRYAHFEGYMFSEYLSPMSPVEQPPPPEPSTGDNWTRSRAFVRQWEGGYQNNPADIGNWTGCAVGVGANKGTKYGISACSYPHLDIINITMEQADEIYFTDYWQESGADKLPWPACLIVFDTAVLHGVGAATSWLDEVGPNPYNFAAKRLRVYTKLDNWHEFGKGWTNRVAALLEECAK